MATAEVLTPTRCLAGRYYRSLRACQHYVPIWHRSVDDVVDVVKELRKPGAV